MKTTKLFKSVFLFLLGTALLTSCSKDDDGGDKFAGVPKGEIVPVAQRHETLTGFAETAGRGVPKSGSLVWWKQIESKVDYHCGDYEDESYAQDNLYVAFNPDGNIYYRIGTEGEGSPYNEWEWKDSNKNSIIVDGEEFELRELNANAVVYASYQSQSSDCYAITWEQFSK